MANESTPRLSRLTAILTRLQSQRLTTATELSDRFEVSVRTIYRDIRALEAAGIPIVTEEGIGYTLMEGFRLPPIMFTEAEANALITAEKIIAENNDASLAKNYSEAILKIKSVLRGNEKDKANLLEKRVAVRKNWGGSTSDYLATLQQAITHGRVVKLEYTSLGKMEKTTRKVEPLALYSTQGNWILIAWCRLREDQRAFRLDQVNGLLVLDEFFEPTDFDLPAFFQSYAPKNTPDIPLSQPAHTFAPSNKTNNKMKDQTQLEAFEIIGIAVRTNNADGSAMKDIPALWQKLGADNIAGKIAEKVDETIYCTYTDYDGDHNSPYTTSLGYKVPAGTPVPEGMIKVAIKPGAYRKFEAKGNLKQGAVYNKWLEIWKHELPRNYASDFERYDHRAMNPENGVCDIFIGLS